MMVWALVMVVMVILILVKEVGIMSRGMEMAPQMVVMMAEWARGCLGTVRVVMLEWGMMEG